MAFPEITDFSKSHPGPYERGMGRTLAALLRLFRDCVPDSESAAKVAELAGTPDRWSAAHAVFDEVRRRLLKVHGDALQARQYAFEEACCQSLYNTTAPDDPFDASAPFFVAPAAFSLAEASGCPMESVVEALKPRWDDSRAADGYLMRPPRLFIFAGLPGAGKTTLARLLARDLRAAYLRIDTVEQALRDERIELSGPGGYVVAYRVAADNLRLGMSVVADSVNPIAITRRAWRDVAAQGGVGFVEIEVICSNAHEHRRRVESRANDIAGHRLPTWHEVEMRERDPWETTPVVIDTAGQTESESFAALRQAIEASDNHALQRTGRAERSL